MYRTCFTGNFVLIGTHAFKLEERKTMIFRVKNLDSQMYVVCPSFIHLGN